MPCASADDYLTHAGLGRPAVGGRGGGRGHGDHRLGVSGLVRSAAGSWSAAAAGEGGHVTLSASDDHKAALIAPLRRRFGHVSAERVLPGPGLVNLWQALGEMAAEALRPIAPQEVTRAAIVDRDAGNMHVLRLFTGWLGSVAGDVALTLIRADQPGLLGADRVLDESSPAA